MSDFVQTMKDWRRMCKALEYVGCNGCKIHTDGNDCVAIYEGGMDYAKAEKAIMAWAAEHPEPVYPTWIEWFRQIGLVPCDQKGFHLWLHDHIPADIAEKLELEPKEGV